MKKYAVLICGSRTVSNAEFVRSILDRAPLSAYSHIIEGGANGADRIGRIWGNDHSVPVDTYPAEWDRYGKSAGPKRNQRMLDEGQPDIVLAFVDKPLSQSRGTAHMVSIARQAGVKVRVFDTVSQSEVTL